MRKHRVEDVRDISLEDAELVLDVRDDKAPLIRGYAARFGKPSKGLPWKEKIQAGAFRKTLQESDVRALWNHNTDFPLGRVNNGTLLLREDEKGLYAEIQPPETTWGADAVASIRRGDVSGMSFGFRVIKDTWNEKLTERDIEEVELFEVSPVTFPAYPQTSVSVRGIEFNPQSLTRARERLGRGCATPQDLALLDELGRATGRRNAEERSAGTPADEPRLKPHSLLARAYRMRLELKELK
jgi:uncharacterized protein